MTSFCGVPAAFRTCQTALQRLSAWVHVEPNFLAFECIRLLLNVLKMAAWVIPKNSASSSCVWQQSSSSNPSSSSSSNFFGCPGRSSSSKPKSPLLNRANHFWHELSYRSNIWFCTEFLMKFANHYKWWKSSNKLKTSIIQSKDYFIISGLYRNWRNFK